MSYPYLRRRAPKARPHPSLGIAPGMDWWQNQALKARSSRRGRKKARSRGLETVLTVPKDVDRAFSAVIVLGIIYPGTLSQAVVESWPLALKISNARIVLPLLGGLPYVEVLSLRD
jgi:hypothetical protein